MGRGGEQPSQQVHSLGKDTERPGTGQLGPVQCLMRLSCFLTKTELELGI